MPTISPAITNNVQPVYQQEIIDASTNQAAITEKPIRIEFDKLVFKKEDQDTFLNKYSEKYDFNGYIAFSRDDRGLATKSFDIKGDNVGNWLHIAFVIFQKLSFLFSSGIDKYIAHGMITFGKNDEEKKLLIGHAVFGNVKTTKHNYIKDPDATGLVAYAPKDEKLRNRIARYTDRIAFTPQKFRKEGQVYSDVEHKFSLTDLFLCMFHRQKSEDGYKRTAAVVADLLRSKKDPALRDENGKPRSFFCTPFATSILQGSILIDSISKDERKKLKNMERAELIQTIYKRLKSKDTNDSLYKSFEANEICQLDARFLMSANACRYLDKASSEAKESQ